MRSWVERCFWSQFTIQKVAIRIHDQEAVSCTAELEGLLTGTMNGLLRNSPLSFGRARIWRLMFSAMICVEMGVMASGTTRSRRKNGNPQSRSVRVMNHAGVPIDIFWIHPHTNELAPSHTSGEGVRFGGETGISSYVGHNFEVQELPSPKTKKCQGKLCRKAYFTVNTNEDQCKW